METSTPRHHGGAPRGSAVPRRPGESHLARVGGWLEERPGDQQGQRESGGVGQALEAQSTLRRGINAGFQPGVIPGSRRL